MSTLVKVKVQPGQTVNFPGLCVRFGTPAVTTMMIRRRRGRLTRQIAVPISGAAADILNSRSPAEARIVTTGRIIAAVLAFVSLLLAILALPPAVPVLLRFILGVAAAAFLIYGLGRTVNYFSLRYADPAKRALLRAARIHTFSWRATTFAFQNDDYADRFRQLNEPYLMAVEPSTT